MRPLSSFLLLPFLLTSACTADDGVDDQVVYAVLDTAYFLYSQNIVGLPVGPQDVTADCQFGGTVQMVGETSGKGGTSVDMVFAFTDCATSGSGYDVTTAGDLAWSGTFSPRGYKALAWSSDQLKVVGPVQGDTEAVDVEENCALAITERGEDGGTSVVSGEWCGREVYF